MPVRRAADRPVRPRLLIVVLGCLAILGPLTIDLYLPAFPQLQDDLATSATSVQLTLSAATLGFALGQLIVGPWSDAVGRRIPLLIATSLHVSASVLIALSPDITWLIVLRVVQGMGAAGSGVVATAMIRDVFEGNRLVHGLARIALFTGIAPVFAPFLGAQLMLALDWRGIFVIVAGYGAAILVTAVLLLPETHRPSALGRTGPGTIWHRYRRVLSDRAFVGVALIGGFMVSSVFAYLSSSAFVLQQQYGMSPQLYGVLSAVNAIAFVVGTQTSAVIVRRRRPATVLSIAVPAMAISAFALAPLGLVGGATPVVVTMILFMLFAGVCGPCIHVIALADHGHEAGTAAALVGAANFGMAGLAAPIVGAIGITSFGPLGLVMGTAMTLGTIVLWALVRPRAQMLPA